jgi:predicted DNA-binding transcriptional regulator AlpA
MLVLLVLTLFGLTPLMADRILTLEEIAQRTRKPINTLRWYRHRGEGPKTFKLGRAVVAYEHDVEAWIAEQAKASQHVGGDAA